MIETEYHPEMFFILPAIAITAGECEDTECDASHWRLTFAWVVWSIHISC